MASIHPTKHGTYEVKWRESGHPKSKSRKTRRAAEQLKAEVERRGEQGRPMMRTQDVPTLKDFANEWLASRTDLEDSTLDRYAEYLGVHVYPDLGHLPIIELKPRRLAEWQKGRLEEGAGPAVLGKAQSLLSQLLNEAVLPHEYLDANPILSMRRPAYKKRPHRWLTAAEVEVLRMWFLEHDDIGSAALISVLAYIGIRPQDALARTWPDLDNKLSVTTKVTGGEIKPGSKTGEGYKRQVFVPDLVTADLEDWRLASHGAGLIFPRAKDGLPWTKTDWGNWRSRSPKGKKQSRPRCFKQAAEDTGLGSALTPYDLRHTAASLYAASGWQVVEIAHQLGHSPAESQRTYQHILISDGSAPRKSIDDYIREARGIAPVDAVRDSFGVEAR